MIEALFAIALIGGFFFLGNHRLTQLKKETEKPFSDFEGQARIRRDLLKNLLEMELDVNSKYERVAAKIEDLCNANTGGKIPFNNWIENENLLTDALAELLPILNAIPYAEMPDNLIELQKKLQNNTSAFIQTAEIYNKAIVGYNHAVIMFPSNAFALIFNFRMRKPVVIPTMG